ncbi:MAG: hypothetical protein IJ011_01780 [Clostridia bacterium]|nr:hypothetical protein [Clostridia bacterium]
MAEYPEIAEARKELLAKAKEAWRFLDEGDIENFNYMNYRTVMKYIPELTTDVADFAVKTVVENFKSLLANEDFRRLCKTVPTSIAHPFNYCGFGEEEKSRFLTLVDDGILRECFAELNKLGAYIEINVSAVLAAGAEMR